MLPELEQSSGATRKYVDDFVAETRGELFPNREACFAFYNRPENFKRLLESEIGDNLMHKYHAIASFLLWPELCAVAMGALKKLAVERGVSKQVPDFDTFWHNLTRYLELQHANGASDKEILGARWEESRYEIPRWISDNTPIDVSEYRLSEPITMMFELDLEGHEGLAAALKVYGTDVKSLTKLVSRVRRNWQVRKCTVSQDQATFAATA